MHTSLVAEGTLNGGKRSASAAPRPRRARPFPLRSHCCVVERRVLSRLSTSAVASVCCAHGRLCAVPTLAFELSLLPAASSRRRVKFSDVPREPMGFALAIVTVRAGSLQGGHRRPGGTAVCERSLPILCTKPLHIRVVNQAHVAMAQPPPTVWLIMATARQVACNAGPQPGHSTHVCGERFTARGSQQSTDLNKHTSQKFVRD
jgi:hypothetical protein